jgi:hypothetical protein
VIGEELASMLAVMGDGPVETGGATAVFEAISGGRLTADVLSSPVARVSQEEKSLLKVQDGEILHVRSGVLRCPGCITVAQVTAVVVNARVPERARASLGITRSGQLMPVPGSTPLGRALRGLGVRREQRAVVLTPGCRDAFGARLALRSSALLLSAQSMPLAWVVERVYARFVETFPPPWPGLPQAAPRPGSRSPCS